MTEYDAKDDGEKSYYAAIEAKRQRGLAAIRKEVVIGDCRLLLGDCLDILPVLGRVDAVVTDPPYLGVKDDGWDNQWQSREDFLAWADRVIRSFEPLMAGNASLYWFCSPQMASRLEVTISRHLQVLNNIVWDKSGGRKGAAGSGVDVTALRSFWTANTERVIFAEKPLGDAEASLVFGSELRSAMAVAGVNNRHLAALFPSRTGGMTGCVSNWLLGLNVPTPEQWAVMSQHLRLSEYDGLLAQYDAIRRPMNLTSSDEWGDVWKFSVERNPEHPTQKPLALIRHIVKASSRQHSTVLDPFMGSGTTGVACVKLGRSFIGIEKDEGYFDIACARIRKAYAQPDFFVERTPEPTQEALL